MAEILEEEEWEGEENIFAARPSSSSDIFYVLGLFYSPTKGAAEAATKDSYALDLTIYSASASTYSKYQTSKNSNSNSDILICNGAGVGIVTNANSS